MTKKTVNYIYNKQELKNEMIKTIESIENYNLDANEARIVKGALQAAHNNQTKAAELLGISRHALIRKLKQINNH